MEPLRGASRSTPLPPGRARGLRGGAAGPAQAAAGSRAPAGRGRGRCCPGPPLGGGAGARPRCRRRLRRTAAAGTRPPRGGEPRRRRRPAAPPGLWGGAAAGARAALRGAAAGGGSAVPRALGRGGGGRCEAPTRRPSCSCAGWGPRGGAHLGPAGSGAGEAEVPLLGLGWRRASPEFARLPPPLLGCPRPGAAGSPRGRAGSLAAVRARSGSAEAVGRRQLPRGPRSIPARYRGAGISCPFVPLLGNKPSRWRGGQGRHGGSVTGGGSVTHPDSPSESRPAGPFSRFPGPSPLGSAARACPRSASGAVTGTQPPGNGSGTGRCSEEKGVDGIERFCGFRRLPSPCGDPRPCRGHGGRCAGPRGGTRGPRRVTALAPGSPGPSRRGRALPSRCASGGQRRVGGWCPAVRAALAGWGFLG
ncbi:uncharacterized protein LOC142403029 [Mycteria americana]|uniref:uncharacterized protein LOC142403029 n=1 Tax=Mycteria americana TaxID=33587 RepID=UPI003F58A0CE